MLLEYYYSINEMTIILIIYFILFSIRIKKNNNFKI